MFANLRSRPFILAALLNLTLLALIPPDAFCANKNDLLTNASAALEDELYEIAEQNLKQYLSLSTDTNQPQTECVIMLARVLHGQKRYQEMLGLLNQNRKGAENSPQADAFAFWLAVACFDNGQYIGALDQTNIFEKRYPESALIPDMIRLRAKILLSLGRNQEAIGALERVIKEYSQSAENANDRLILGQILANSGLTEEASAILETLLTYPPETSTGQKCRSILGQIYIAQKQWQKARLAYEALFNQNNIPDIYRLQAIQALSEIAVSQTNFSEALRLLDNGYRLVPNPAHQLEISRSKGLLLLKMNRIDEGTLLIHEYVSAQTTNSPGANLQLELAQTLLAKGLNDKALTEFQNFIESFASQPNLVEAYNGKGTALFNLARYHEAAAALGKADELSNKPDEKARYRYRTADAFFAAGQFKSATETYEQVVRLTPDTPLAHMALFQTGECNLRMDNWPAAEAIFWKIYDEDLAVDLAPRALLRIADLLLQRNELSTAAMIYDWINHEHEDQWRAQAIYGLGMIAYRSGRFAEALLSFEETMRLASDAEVAAAAAYMGAWSCFMLDKPDEARKRFAGVVSSYHQTSKAPDAIFWLGEYDYNCRRFESAENSFRLLASEYPRAPLADDALFWAGRAALNQNDFKRARDYFSALIKRYPSSAKRPDARYFQGIALCELGQYDAAILIFNEIIKQYPDNALAESAAFKKGDCHFILGSDESKRYTEALNSYRLILDRTDLSAASRLQAKYKIGRCLEKLGRADEAFAQYLQVVYSYVQNQEQNDPCNLWFARAAFNAAGIMEEKQQWRKAAAIYQRVIEADIPASRDAQERIAKLRAEHWLFFY